MRSSRSFPRMSRGRSSWERRPANRPANCRGTISSSRIVCGTVSRNAFRTVGMKVPEQERENCRSRCSYGQTELVNTMALWIKRSAFRISSLGCGEMTSTWRARREAGAVIPSRAFGPWAWSWTRSRCPRIVRSLRVSRCRTSRRRLLTRPWHSGRPRCQGTRLPPRVLAGQPQKHVPNPRKVGVAESERLAVVADHRGLRHQLEAVAAEAVEMHGVSAEGLCVAPDITVSRAVAVDMEKEPQFAGHESTGSLPSTGVPSDHFTPSRIVYLTRNGPRGGAWEELKDSTV